MPKKSTTTTTTTTPAGPSSKSHRRFDQPPASGEGWEDDQDTSREYDDDLMFGEMSGLEYEEPGQKHQGGTNEDGDEEEEDSDAPEAISTAVGKKSIKEQQKAMRDFETALAQTKRKANQSRDAKLKDSALLSKKPKHLKRTASLALPTTASSEDSDTEPSPETTTTTTTSLGPSKGTKRYLDPSIFASASEFLNNAAKEDAESKKQESELAKASKKKRRKVDQDPSRKEIKSALFPFFPPPLSALKKLTPFVNSRSSSGLTVQHLSAPTTSAPSQRPKSASNFETRRLYTSGRHANVPKATIEARQAIGSRKPATVASGGKRRAGPALGFVRAGK